MHACVHFESHEACSSSFLSHKRTIVIGYIRLTERFLVQGTKQGFYAAVSVAMRKSKCLKFCSDGTVHYVCENYVTFEASVVILIFLPGCSSVVVRLCRIHLKASPTFSARNVSRRSHHHILRRGGAGSNPTGSPGRAGKDATVHQDDGVQQQKHPNTFEEKVSFLNAASLLFIEPQIYAAFKKTG